MATSRGGRGDPALIGKYLKEIGTYPLLTPEEEKDLARRIQKGDAEALQRLVEGNLRFVVSYAKRYHNSHVSLLDLINEGNIGLIQAAQKFDPDRNVKFITYAVWWIRQAILHLLSEQGNSFRLPQKQAALLYKLQAAKATIARKQGREVSAEELAEELGVAPEEVRILLSAGTDSVSLSTPIGDDQNSELGELLEQISVPPTDAAVMKRALEEQAREVLGKLSEKEDTVLRMRFGIDTDEPKTLREIGEKLNLSRERIRQIENQALAKCRHHLKARTLRGLLN